MYSPGDTAERIASMQHFLRRDGMAFADDAAHTDIYGIPLLGTGIGEDTFPLKLHRISTLLEHHPEVGLAITETQVAGFHGTSSAALPGIVACGGLVTAEKALRDGQELFTGERQHSKIGGQDFISFADWREPASIRHYARYPGQPLTLESLRAEEELWQTELTSMDAMLKKYSQNEEQAAKNPYVQNARQKLVTIGAIRDYLLHAPDGPQKHLIQQNFPIALGVNVHRMDSVLTSHSITSANSYPLVQDIANHSQIPGEFVIYPQDGLLPYADLPVTAVPEQHVATVRELYQASNIQSYVVALEPIIN
jgi:hypothetical protein